MSVSITASITGAATWTAAPRMPLNASWTPSTSELMSGAAASGTAS